MNSTDFETSKLQAVEKLTGRYDKYITKLKKMFGKTRGLERAAAQRFLADMGNTVGEEEEKPEPDLIFMNIPLYQPITDMQPFKAMRDFARRTGGEDVDGKANTSTVSKETA